MRRLIGIFVMMVALFASIVFSAPAGAELDVPQGASWGLAGPASTSNSVGDFEALGWAVEESGDHMFVGGKFQNVTNGAQTVEQSNFARFSLDGKWDPMFTPSVERPVLSIAAAPDGGLLVGGEVRVYNGANVGSLVKVDAETGDVWPGWNLKVTGGTNVVREVTVEADGWAYVVGSFREVRHDGTITPVTNIFRFNPENGEPDTSWLPAVTGGSVWDVSVSKTTNTVYVAGWYDTIVGSDRAAVGIHGDDATKLTWDSFENNGNARVQYGVEATEFGHVWVVGEQHGVWVHDETQDFEVIKEHVTHCHREIQGDCTRRGGAFQEIERVGDRIYATCHCWGHHASADGPTPTAYPGELTDEDQDWELTGSVNGIVAYDAATGDRDESFNPPMSGRTGGFGVAQASDGCLWTTGSYTSVGLDEERRSGRDLVRLCDGGESVTAPASCVAVRQGGEVKVSWPAVDGASEYVVRRSVDEGTQYWRGRVVEPSFTDQDRSGSLAYTVEVKSAAGEFSSQTSCTTEEETILPQPVSSCAVATNGDQVKVTWPAIPGATSYVVYRTVNDSPQYWRGIVADETSFDDSLRSGSIDYFVAAKFGRERTERVACDG